MIRSLVAALSLLLLPAAAGAACPPPERSDAEILASPAVQAAIAEADAEIANPRGRLWRIERNGIPPSYLFGTYHVPIDNLEVPPEPVADLVKDARALLVELSPNEIASANLTFLLNPSLLLNLDGPPLSERMSVGQLARLEAALDKVGLSLREADRLKPAWLMMLLGQPPCVVEIMQARTPGLDETLMRLAEEQAVPIVSLETVREQLEAIDRALPDDRAIPLLLLALESAEEGEDFLYEGVALYRSGEIGATWTFATKMMEQSPMPGIDAGELEGLIDLFTEVMLVNRNRLMLERALPELEKGNAVIAVGALHLPFDVGLVALLREAGFRVTRMPAVP